MTTRVFSRDDPCTKKHLYECFWDTEGMRFRKVLVTEALSLIGRNAPRYMLGTGYISLEVTPRAEFYRLTEAGEEWLLRGIASYAKNHPDEVIAGYPPRRTRQRPVRR